MRPDNDLIGGRYILHEQQGTGSQGTVYRATDRLTGQTVALKRVTAPLRQSEAMAEEELRLTLANEFQTLASLHHPYIIGVLDYGFDAQRQPYFTMDYLRDAQTILEAGAGKPVAAQVELLIQVLEALVYLHRQGVLHRDLKPSNVLVVDGVARVTDFGLSVSRDQARGAVGTFAYLAPEVMVGKPAGEPADLYAVGIIAYELFAGRHPFDLANLSRFINGALNASPDLAALGVDSDLAAVVGCLLAKDPHSRYANAEAAIAAFSRAVGRALPRETSAIRESFLQAAKFVGRRTELSRLTRALDEACAGRGSAWLVGGESGVGKSRLLDELRTRALVRGALAHPWPGRRRRWPGLPVVARAAAAAGSDRRFQPSGGGHPQAGRPRHRAIAGARCARRARAGRTSRPTAPADYHRRRLPPANDTHPAHPRGSALGQREP